MKALIVDDEKHVRTSIRHLIDWEAYGIDRLLEAENGTEAIQIIQAEHPHLVITDIMMPLTTGVELMEWMQVHASECQKIVISGYNDFEYVRHTVKNGGVDYLLKPIEQRQLQEAIGKAIRSLNATQKEHLQYVQLGMEVNELKPIYRDKLLSGLFSESDMKDSTVGWEPLYREFPELQKARSCRIAILDVNMLERSIREKFESNQDLLLFSLINICNEFMQAKNNGVAFRNWYKRFEIVLLIWGDLNAAKNMIESIQEGITLTLKTQIQMGIGSSSPFPHGLKQAYSEALQALGQRNLLGSSTYIFEYQEAETSRMSTLRFSEFEEEIRMAIKSGRVEQIRNALRNWFQVVCAMKHISLDQLEKWRVEYNVNKARWIEEYIGDTIEPMPAAAVPFIIPLNDEGNLSLVSLEQQIMQELTALSQILSSQQIQNSSSTIHEIARFIKINYKQDITLTDISARFHFNREYISRRFKQEFNETLIEYLNRIRVEKAKLLLMNPINKISQVAQMVGYQDEKYFSRVFKKVTGQTPKEYRNQCISMVEE